MPKIIEICLDMDLLLFLSKSLVYSLPVEDQIFRIFRTMYFTFINQLSSLLQSIFYISWKIVVLAF